MSNQVWYAFKKWTIDKVLETPFEMFLFLRREDTSEITDEGGVAVCREDHVVVKAWEDVYASSPEADAFMNQLLTLEQEKAAIEARLYDHKIVSMEQVAEGVERMSSEMLAEKTAS